MENNYTPGVFIKKSKNPRFTTITVKLEELITYLQELKADDKGLINFTVAPQKVDTNKFSMWLDTWKPDPSKRSTKPAENPDEGNDLPF